MEVPEKKTRINTANFVQDFVSGVPNNELADKYNVSLAQLSRVVEALQDRGHLTSEHVAQREKCRARADRGVQVEDTPFAVIRGRSLLLCAICAGVAGIFYGGIICLVCLPTQPACVPKQSSSPDVLVMGVVSYCFFILLLRALLSRAKLTAAAVFGLQPTWPMLGRYVLLVFPIILTAIASIFLLYFPLSYLVPQFVQSYLLHNTLVLLTRDSPLTNLLSFLIIVLIAPVTEEFLFRGLLLTRWSLKWNVRRGIFLSSLFFGLGHGDILGAFFFGYLLCVVYIETKSLLVPIIIHMANNGLVWILTGISVLTDKSDAKVTLAEWQSYWWIGLLATVIVIPWVIWFTKRHFPTAGWRVPYLSLREDPQQAQGNLKTL